MKIAIHHTEGSFSEEWIKFCQDNNLDYKLVNCYDSEIIKQIKDCDTLMWHHNHLNHKDILFAKQLLFSIEQSGKKVFPNFNTNWHFDDKIGQKYLLESIDAALVPSYVFYTKKEAMEWVVGTTFPKVAKLRGGSGSSNVRLIKNIKDFNKYTSVAFGKGFDQFSKKNYIKEKLRHYNSAKGKISDLLKIIYRFFVVPEFYSNINRELNYVYFQDFIPDNEFDIRIVVIGDKAIGIKRLVRENDFRASGSGNIIYNVNEIDIRCVELAFLTNKKLKMQVAAVDFVFDENKNPLIVEVSYGFDSKGYLNCSGYWDVNLEWHQQKVNMQQWMIEDLLGE